MATEIGLTVTVLLKMPKKLSNKTIYFHEHGVSNLTYIKNTNVWIKNPFPLQAVTYDYIFFPVFSTEVQQYITFVLSCLIVFAFLYWFGIIQCQIGQIETVTLLGNTYLQGHST